MTYKSISAGPDGAAMGKQEDIRGSSAKVRLGSESATPRCAPGGLAKHGPVMLSPICPLSAGETRPKSILDPTFRYTASFATDLKRTFARVRLDRRRAAEKEAKASIQACGNVSPIVRTSTVVRPYALSAGLQRHDAVPGANRGASASQGKQETASADREAKEDREAAEEAR